MQIFTRRDFARYTLLGSAALNLGLSYSPKQRMTLSAFKLVFRNIRFIVGLVVVS